ncbi:transketolase, partial [Candidatus Gottesmanbacteria bacterium]|nr:transketolase [Candidatus Gottesmanbacteria bacterium]
IRYYILTMTTTAGSGHASSSLSAVELMTALFFTEFRADLDHPDNSNNDRLIFSKGHASPLFYSLYAAAGKLTLDNLLKYRKFESPLEGHPTLEFPYTEAPTGSLGQGLSIGLGEALALRNLTGPATRVSQTTLQNRSTSWGSRPVKLRLGGPLSRHPSDNPNVFVLLGDGEMAEGSVWEAIQAAAFRKVDNLVAILDVNRLGQSQETMFGHDLSAYKKRFEVFGWRTIVVKNGHDLKQVLKAFKKLRTLTGRGKPVVIIAKTFKGYGIKVLQNQDNWHGKPIPPDLLKQALSDLGKVDLDVKGIMQKPIGRREISNFKFQISNKIQNPNYKFQKRNYKIGESVATRQAAGDALTELMDKYPQVVVLDGDVKNSLYTENTQKAHPDRFFEMFIAEQNMTGVAVGLSRRGYIPFVTTFSAFMTRAFDQIRMAGLGKANIKFIGSHAGVSIGEDGASQMGLEDLSMFRSVFGSTVLYPADAVSAQKLVEEMIKRQGICYLRVARPVTPVIYRNSEEFPIGGSKIHTLSSRSASWRSGDLSNKIASSRKSGTRNDKKIVIIAAGVTLYEALKAQAELEKDGIEAIVVDCYSVKPIDEKTLKELAVNYSSNEVRSSHREARTITNIITVEDHWSEGGLGDAVLNVFSENPEVKVYKLAVSKMPHSGKPQELLDFEEISAKAIVEKVKEVF